MQHAASKYGYADVMSDMRELTERARKLRATAERYDLKMNEIVYMKIRLEYLNIAEDAAAVFHRYEHTRHHECMTEAQRETAADAFARMMFAIVETSQKL